MEKEMCKECEQCDSCIPKGYVVSLGTGSGPSDFGERDGCTPKKEHQISRQINELNGTINYLEKTTAELKKVLLNSVCRDLTVPTTSTDNKKIEQHLVPVAEEINAIAKRIRKLNNTINDLVEGLEL